jgi:hypothetical protein
MARTSAAKVCTKAPRGRPRQPPCAARGQEGLRIAHLRAPDCRVGIAGGYGRQRREQRRGTRLKRGEAISSEGVEMSLLTIARPKRGEQRYTQYVDSSLSIWRDFVQSSSCHNVTSKSLPSVPVIRPNSPSCLHVDTHPTFSKQSDRPIRILDVSGGMTRSARRGRWV